MALADGNPRMLHWFDLVLRYGDIDADATFQRLESKAAEFHEEHLLAYLLDSLQPEAKTLLASLALIRHPVAQKCVTQIADGLPLYPHLERIQALGLVEVLGDGKGNRLLRALSIE